MLAIAVLMFSLAPLFGYLSQIRSATVVSCSVISIVLSFRAKVENGGPFILGFMVFSVISMLSILWCDNVSGALTRLIDLFEAVLIATAIAFNKPKLNEIHFILDAYLIGVILVSVVCCWVDRETLTSWSRLGKTVFESAGSSLIEYSCILIYSQMYVAYRFFSSSCKTKWGIAFCFLFVCGMLTGVRKALIIPLLFVYVYQLIINRKNALKIIGYTALAIIIVSLIFLLVNTFFVTLSTRMWNLVFDITQGTNGVAVGGDSYETRSWLRETAWQAFLENSLIGLGVGQFAHYSLLHGGPLLYAHNNYLELLANMGVVGFLCYYGAIVLLVRQLWSVLVNTKENCKIRQFACFGISFIVAVLVMEYGQVDYYQVYYLVMPFLLSSFADSATGSEMRIDLDEIRRQTQYSKQYE